MKVLPRRTSISPRKVAGALRKGAGAVFRGVRGIPRAPKVLAKRRMTRAMMDVLLVVPENERVPLKPIIQRPGFKSYGMRDSKGNFRVEVIDTRWNSMEPVEERLFNSKGLLMRLISHVPGQGKYVWDYRNPASGRAANKELIPADKRAHGIRFAVNFFLEVEKYKLQHNPFLKAFSLENGSW